MAEDADQNTTNEGAEESEANESVEGADMSNESTEETDADPDNGSDDSGDEIRPFSTQESVRYVSQLENSHLQSHLPNSGNKNLLLRLTIRKGLRLTRTPLSFCL